MKEWEGVYVTCDEVSGYMGESLELKDGRFRYWFYGDAGSDRTKYPLKGVYEIIDGKLRLRHPSIRNETRTLDVLNGTKVLWRRDGLEVWQGEKAIHPYAVLIRVPQKTVATRISKIVRPSIERIKSAEVLALDEERYQKRFNDLPEPARTVFREGTARAAPESGSTLEQLRANPSPEIFRQLAAMLAFDNPNSVPAYSYLQRLVPETGYSPRAIEFLIDSFSVVPERSGLEKIAMLLMERIRVQSFDLEIPEGGVRVKLKRTPKYASFDSQDLSENAPADHKWTEKMKVISAACQSWWRERVSLNSATKAR